MRRLLLATTAVLGGVVGGNGLANAQTTPAPTTVPLTQFTGAPATPGAIPSQIFSPFTAVPGTTPGPATITVRLDGRINFYMMAGSDSGRNPGVVTTAAGAAPVATNTKLSDYTFQNYTRLFPSFDGIAANGLKYGGWMEVRQDNAVAPGGGINGSISGATRARGALYVRDNFVYIGTDQLGYLRGGSGWGPTTLFITGSFENFNDGAWNGDAPAMFTGSNQLAWPFMDVSTFYSLDKITYLSPQIAGFDMGVSFAPSTANVNEGVGNCSYANSAASASGLTGVAVGGGGVVGCDATASTSVLAETRRARDIVELEGRYRGAFGPIGVVAQAGGVFSGKVGYDGVAAPALRYSDLEIGDGGFQVTYGGLAVGGHVTAGKTNTGFALDPQSGKDYMAWLLGSSYAVGPFIVGASYFALTSAGSQSGATKPYVGGFREYGVAAGGSYALAPGMNVFLAYLYGHQNEKGVDLLSGTTSSAAGFVSTHNTIQAQGVSIGTQFKW
jgi:hypothetical protein